MKREIAIKLFSDKKVRVHWDDNQEKWYFSIIDVVAILTRQSDHQGARNYWKVLKKQTFKRGKRNGYKL